MQLENKAQESRANGLPAHYSTSLHLVVLHSSVCDGMCVQVIAVVMDVFTDVDIFRDLLDVSFKGKVSVYILLERTAIPHFLSMCERAGMHSGHLKVKIAVTHTHTCNMIGKDMYRKKNLVGQG